MTRTNREMVPNFFHLAPAAFNTCHMRGFYRNAALGWVVHRRTQLVHRSAWIIRKGPVAASARAFQPLRRELLVPRGPLGLRALPCRLPAPPSPGGGRTGPSGRGWRGPSPAAAAGRPPPERCRTVWDEDENISAVPCRTGRAQAQGNARGAAGTRARRTPVARSSVQHPMSPAVQLYN